MTNRPKKAAYSILQKRKLYKQLSVNDLYKIIEEKGFKIIEYKKYSYSNHLKVLIEKLKIEEKIQNKNCFIYIKDNLKLVFIDQDVSDDDKIILLSHETGHIYDSRILESNFLYTETQREDYANEFSHYLRNAKKFINFLAFNLKKIIIAIVMITLVVASIAGIRVYRSKQASIQATISTSSKNKLSPHFYYVSSSGTKYHKHYCKHMKNKTNITAYSMKNAIKKGYKPCLDCIGEGLK